MRAKLHFSLIAFFVLFVAQAQKITENTLPGEWIPVGIIIPEDGTIINFEKNEVTLSDKMQAKITETKGDAEEFKTYLLEGFAVYKDIFRVVIEPGIINRFEDGKTIGAPFTLIEKDGKQYLDIDGEMNYVYMQNGNLVMAPSAGQPGFFTIILKKQ
ncbi:MAG: hypothetical protein EOP54_21895 [Sphingobacteriales bacterium]|nr:MAG: hypothetical protein EOP54_21895 [Sphingobacteriales bacterium]